ncbi:MAG TPA: hypothetical protein VEF34_04870 [Syntrophobacteraceae bacterium]|nr:hypothetical protein [Syntrophobacteraceae bacterium]
MNQELVLRFLSCSIFENPLDSAPAAAGVTMRGAAGMTECSEVVQLNVDEFVKRNTRNGHETRLKKVLIPSSRSM